MQGYPIPDKVNLKEVVFSILLPVIKVRMTYTYQIEIETQFELENINSITPDIIQRLKEPLMIKIKNFSSYTLDKNKNVTIS